MTNPTHGEMLVKALEWTVTFGQDCITSTGFGTLYSIQFYDGMDKPAKLTMRVPNSGPPVMYSSIPEAKAAAQADYTARILSALVPPEQTEGATLDAPLSALSAASPARLSREEKIVWILGDMMNAVENYFGAENPKRLGHINSAAIRIIDEVLARPRPAAVAELTPHAFEWTLFGNGATFEKRLTFTRDDPFAVSVSMSPDNFTSVCVPLYVEPLEKTEGAVAWTGSGSLTAVERGDQGFIWPSKEPAHPIPLYARPSPAAAHTAEIARLREALGWVISSPHIAREVARAALKTEASVSPAADVAEPEPIAEKLRQAYHNDLTDVPLLLDAADLIDTLSAENAELKRERSEDCFLQAGIELARRVETAEARAEKAERERDEARAAANQNAALWGTATSTLARMRAALEEIAQQPLSNEAQGDVEDEEIGDFVGGYDLCVQRARTALKGTAS